MYTDLSPRGVEVLALWLVNAFGGAGLALAGKERQEDAKAAQERQRLADAIGDLQ